MENPLLRGRMFEQSYHIGDQQPAHAVAAIRAEASRAVWGAVANYFAEGGAGIVIYSVEKRRQGSMDEFTMTVEIRPHEVADAAFKRRLEINRLAALRSGQSDHTGEDK